MRSTRKLVALAIAGCVAAAIPATHAAAAVKPATQMSPAGHYVRLGLAGGKQFHADLNDGVVADCTTSTSVPTAPVGTNTNNQIPTTNNPTTHGPVALAINPFTYSGCTSPSAGDVNVTASGTWGLSVQYSSTALPVVRITIPQAGLVVHATSAGCTGTFAPDGPVTLIGRWRDGSPPRMTVRNQGVPVRVTGSFVCLPADYTGTIGFTYLVRNRTDPEAFVTVNGLV